MSQHTLAQRLPLINRIANLRISVKLPLLFSLITILTGSVIGYQSVHDSASQAIDRAAANFKAIVFQKQVDLKEYLDNIVDDLYVTSSSPTVVAAVQDFTTAWSVLGSDQKDTLQRLYIERNPNPTGSKENLDYADDGSIYSSVHAKYHPWMRDFLRTRGYYDVFIFDTRGNILYTVFKELDFATNILNGEWRDTGLATVYRKALGLGSNKDDIAFVDFAPYAPSNNVPASFIARPIRDVSGKIIGVLAFQMPIGRINNIMQQSEGTRKTGEIFTVGQDLLMRSDSKFEKESTILNKKIDTEAVTKALNGEKGVIASMLNTKGQEVLSAYAPLDFSGVRWAVIGQITRSEIDAPITELKNSILIEVAIISLIIAALGSLAARSIAGRINKISATIAATVDSKSSQTNIEIPFINSTDEIGDIARSLDMVNKQGQASLRVKISLDNMSGNVMIADKDNIIIYLNKSLEKMLQGNEAAIRKDLPNFDVKTLIGTKIDVFHKNPAHQTAMLANLRSTYETTITVGGLLFDLIANPVFNEAGERLGTSVEWKDVTQTRKQEQQMIRLNIALDNMTSNLMMADESNVIIYVNKAVKAMLKRAEGNIRKDLPNFDVEKLIGTKIDDFHKNPAHQTAMLANLKTVYNTTIRVGGCIFDLIANPVFDANGHRLGTTVEWKDVTAERHIEGEIQGIVDAASKGDFTRRLALEGKEGFMLRLAEGINAINNITESSINSTLTQIDALSQGDLSQTMEGDYDGVFAQMQGSLNQTIIRLRDIVSNIQSAAEQVSSASAEISAGSTDLAQRTQEQASSLEETAASMEELTGTVRQNSENARNANNLAGQARNIAEEGGKVVNDAVSAMGNIEQSSQKIAEIIGVIDEIAFQTNLLALNAAVEAARAGEAGKGFAVVASEVRSLAGRSASASKEIKELINASGLQVKNGSELVNQAGKTLTEIVNSVKMVADLIADIAKASEEQSTGIGEVSSAVSQMDEVTQQNAALVEENEAAAGSLVEQARQLDGLMRFFKLNEQDEGSSGSGMSSFEKAATKPTVKPAAQPSKPMAKPIAKPAPKKPAPAPNTSVDNDWEEF